MWPLSRVLKTFHYSSQHSLAYLSLHHQNQKSHQELPAQPREADCSSEQKWGVVVPRAIKMWFLCFTWGHRCPSAQDSSAEAKLMRKQLIPAQICSECPHPPDGASGSSGKFQKLSKNEKCVNDLGDPCLLACRRWVLALNKEWMEAEAYQPYWFLSFQLPSIVFPQMGSWDFLKQESSWG